ncbi:putative ICE2 [Lyophyllum shimeji]|uniref:ICE2 n=1 Tax=Lyophyllum shimeji TaxID=47721 RepID=A0A9P3PIM1_LYOSH|nr:putative ICE2 [Lyophyllum shimeji]
MLTPWFLWSAVSHTARLSTVLQILIFLPLTLATLSTQAFLLLSLLLSIHSLIHGTLILLWGSDALSVLQVPMHPFLLLVCFNAFSASVHPWLITAADWWGAALTFSGPMFIAMEGLSSLLVVQKLGQQAKRLVTEGEAYQFALLVASAIAYVISAWWIVVSYPAAASSPLSSTLLGVAITAFLFLTFIGFYMRRTNIIESSGLAIFIAYNVWLCGFDQKAFTDPASSYAPLLPNLLPHFRALLNFIINTLPKPVLLALLYRLAILHFASRILPTIGADSWESEEGVHDGWEDRPTSYLTRILLTYRQFIFVTVYSHLLLLDHSSQIWWRWMNIFLTLVIWSVELFVSSEDDVPTKDWKVD